MRVEGAEGTPALRASTSSRETATTGIPIPFGQTFHRAQAHAHAGKAPGPVDGDDCMSSPSCSLGRAQQIADRSHQRRRVGAPGKLDLPKNFEIASGESAPAQPSPSGPQVSIARSSDSPA